MWEWMLRVLYGERDMKLNQAKCTDRSCVSQDFPGNQIIGSIIYHLSIYLFCVLIDTECLIMGHQIIV